MLSFDVSKYKSTDTGPSTVDDGQLIINKGYVRYENELKNL